jgi:hypothetical protein
VLERLVRKKLVCDLGIGLVVLKLTGLLKFPSQRYERRRRSDLPSDLRRKKDLGRRRGRALGHGGG